MRAQHGLSEDVRLRKWMGPQDARMAAGPMPQTQARCQGHFPISGEPLMPLRLMSRFRVLTAEMEQSQPSRLRALAVRA